MLLVCDTARADAFTPWGGGVPTPGIARLAAEGLVYERALTPAPWTLPAHGSLFSGLLPTEHGIVGDRLRWGPEGPSAPASLTRSFDGPWLPEGMAERGYRTVGVSCNPWIGRWGGFDRGFEAFVDVVPRPTAASTAGPLRRMVGRARQMARGGGHGGVAALRAFRHMLDQGRDPRPLFAFVNLMEVHSPYDPPRRVHPAPLRPSMRYRQFRQMGRFRTRFDPAYVADLRALYYAAAREADRLVDRFVAVLGARARPALVVLVSDHGENLGDHGLWGHHSSLHETLLHVPFLVWGPGAGIEAGRVAGAVSIRAVASFLLRTAEGDLSPPAADPVPIVAEYESATGQFGTDLPPEVRVSAPPLVRSAGVAIREGNLKLVALLDGTVRLVDPTSDPAEELDLSRERPDALARLRVGVDEWRRRRAAWGRRPEAEGPDLEEEIAAHLRDLGYLE